MKSLLTLFASLAIVVCTFAMVQAQEEACACKAMPTFRVTGTDGKIWSQTTITNRPTVVVFLKAGCPHNAKGVADMNRLRSALGDKVGFVGVTDLPLADAKRLARDLGVQFPVLPDPAKTIVNGFAAGHSLDIALTCPEDKRIANSWEGYSQDILKELVAAIHEHGGPQVRLDYSAFPAGLQSGCSF